MNVSVDFGGTNTRVAVFEEDARAFEQVAAFKTQATYEAQLGRLLAVIAPLEPASLGLAVGAQLDPGGRSIAVSYTMPDMVGPPLVADLGARLGCPVVAANDNVCGVIAEHTYGVLEGAKRAAYLTVSTGTGAGIRLEEKGVALAFLAQLGHHVVNPLGDKCACGQVGCLQAVTGGQHVERTLGHGAAEIKDEAFWQTFTRTLAIGIVNLARITRGLLESSWREHLERLDLEGLRRNRVPGGPQLRPDVVHRGVIAGRARGAVAAVGVGDFLKRL